MSFEGNRVSGRPAQAAGHAAGCLPNLLRALDALTLHVGAHGPTSVAEPDPDPLRVRVVDRLNGAADLDVAAGC